VKTCLRPAEVLFLLLACTVIPDQTLDRKTAAMDFMTDQGALPAQDPAGS
jgi:hypothetical protein